jgi:hypothetical protein
MARQAKPADPKVAGRGFRPCALRQCSVLTSYNPSIKEKGASSSQIEKILSMPENQDVAFKGCLLDNPRCDELGETHRHDLSLISYPSPGSLKISSEKMRWLTATRNDDATAYDVSAKSSMAVHLSPLSNLKIFVTSFIAETFGYS